MVEGQRIMQAASDIFLGWTEDLKAGRFFYIATSRTEDWGQLAKS